MKKAFSILLSLLLVSCQTPQEKPISEIDYSFYRKSSVKVNRTDNLIDAVTYEQEMQAVVVGTVFGSTVEALAHAGQKGKMKKIRNQYNLIDPSDEIASELHSYFSKKYFTHMMVSPHQIRYNANIGSFIKDNREIEVFLDVQTSWGLQHFTEDTGKYYYFQSSKFQIYNNQKHLLAFGECNYKPDILKIDLNVSAHHVRPVEEKKEYKKNKTLLASKMKDYVSTQPTFDEWFEDNAIKLRTERATAIEYCIDYFVSNTLDNDISQ